MSTCSTGPDFSSGFPAFISAGDILTDLVRAAAPEGVSTTSAAAGVPGMDSHWRAHPGGAGWNVARAVARLGLPTACAGALGTDNFSDELWNASVAAGLDMRFMQRVERAPLLAIVHQTHPPAYYFIGEHSADLAFDPAKLPEGWRTHAKWAHFGCISLVRQPLGETLATLAAQLRAQGVKISFDPNYRNLMAHGYEPILHRMAALADLIKVSDEDLRMLFADKTEPEAIAAMRALNPAATLLVTRGAQAATLYVGDEVFEAAPPRVEVADTVGAGDASIGGLLFSLMSTPQRSWPQHLAFSLAAGAAACRRAGAYSPTLDEVVALIAD